MVIAWGYSTADDIADDACWTSVADEDGELLPSHAAYCANHWREVPLGEWLADERKEVEAAVRDYEEVFEEGFGRLVVMSGDPPEVKEETYRAGRAAMDHECRCQADLVRDIFGNPFCPFTFDPAWRSDTAVSLARGMYESRDFSAMPILADALQDAGCDNADVLDHCRDENATHVRGCWVVDLVLGKE
jgi:hypothetical protein